MVASSGRSEPTTRAGSSGNSQGGGDIILMPRHAERRLTTILAADIAEYSRLMRADEDATLRGLTACRAIIEALVAEHRGRIANTAGDALLMEFPSAVDGLVCAIAIQRAIAKQNEDFPPERRMLFRIGVHCGDVIPRDGDLFGDAVNVAARLQALAEPGGICVSATVREHVGSRVSAAFADGGLQSVKNIAEPVHAYAVHPGRSAPGPTAGPVEAPVVAPPTRSRPSRRWLALAAASVLTLALIGAVTWYATGRLRTADPPPIPAETGALPLPGKPSIAVLPFENLSGEAEQAYFADGITEDLITDLSKVSGLFVIARNSTFVYKGKSHDVREVARTLGVRYVLEGSVRRSGGDIRVNAQLVDATTGGHVWADRYDGDMKNIFGLQDKVTHSVVTAMAVELTRDDRARVARRGTENAQAYDVFLKGWEQYLRQSPEGFRAAIEYFKQAATLDPSYTRAYAALAATYWEAATRYWDIVLGFRRHHEAQYQAEQYLAKAMRDPTPLAHQVSSAMLLIAQQHEEAIAAAKRSIAADPNDAGGYIALAAAMSFTGRPTEALAQVERAMRLNPHYPPSYLYQLGLARFGMKRFPEAAASLERAVALNPDDHWAGRLLLATYGQLGRREDASKLLDTMTKKDARGLAIAWDPLTIRAITYWYPYTGRPDADRLTDGLRRAGVPD